MLLRVVTVSRSRTSGATERWGGLSLRRCHRLVWSAQPVEWDQRRFAAPAHPDFSTFSGGGPALETSWSHPTLKQAMALGCSRSLVVKQIRRRTKESLVLVPSPRRGGLGRGASGESTRRSSPLPGPPRRGEGVGKPRDPVLDDHPGTTAPPSDRTGTTRAVWSGSDRNSLHFRVFRGSSGIIRANSGLQNRLGLGWLKVRGRGAVFRTLLLKVSGGNILRAATSAKLRALVRALITQLLKTGWSKPLGQPHLASLAGLHCSPQPHCRLPTTIPTTPPAAPPRPTTITRGLTNSQRQPLFAV